MRLVMTVALTLIAASATAQLPDPAAWRRVARRSNVVVSATAIHRSHLEWPERRDAQTIVHSDGTVGVVGSGSAYRAGTVTTFHVDEILAGGNVDVAISGTIEVYLSEGSPQFRLNHAYLLFLERPPLLFEAADDPVRGWERLYGAVVRSQPDEEPTVFHPNRVFGLTAALHSGGTESAVLRGVRPPAEEEAIIRQAIISRDRVPPVVSMGGSLANALLRENVLLGALATDEDSGILTVEFLLDGTPLSAQATAAPYSVTWDSRYRPDGWHLISAAATDLAGNVAVSAGVPVIIDNTAPTLAVHTTPSSLMPADGTMREVAVTVTVSDAVDPAPTVVLASITANENLEQGDVSGASIGSDDRSVSLRAWAVGGDNQPSPMRVYTLTYEARDRAGNVRGVSTTVSVVR